MILKELQIILPRRVANDLTQRALYSRDMMTGATLELKAGDRPHLPDLVCWPETVDEVSRIVRFARRHRMPIVPYGGGSGVCGAAIPTHGGIILDMKRMKRIESITEGLPFPTAVVQTGILGQHLEEQLNQKGWTLGHFPSSIMCSTLGGYIACRAAGQMSSKYGKIEDMVEEIEAVLPDGEIVPFGGSVKKFPKIRPKEIFLGAEGTMGIVTRARLKIHPMPPTSRYRGVSFNGLASGLQAIQEILQAGLRPSVVRLYDPLDSMILQFGYEKGAGNPFTQIIGKVFKIPLPIRQLKTGGLHALLRFPSLAQNLIGLFPPEVILILGFEGEASFAEAQERIALGICQRSICRDLGPKPGLHWLKHRYSVSFKMPQFFEKGCFVDTIEVASTWDLIQELYEKIHRALSQKCLVMAHFSHAYPEGCSIYFTIAGRTGSAERDKALYHEIWEEAMRNCLSVGGTITHHHGVGTLKAKYLPLELGPEGMVFLREIKKKIDPLNIMNPGKLGL